MHRILCWLGQHRFVPSISFNLRTRKWHVKQECRHRCGTTRENA